jgi:thioredoxin reductase
VIPLDVIVIGGGPAGLSAALMLGRCRRRVLVCDAGEPRNRASRASHGYLTRDGMAPGTLLECGRAELETYGVEVRRATVAAVKKRSAGFELEVDDGSRLLCRIVLIATGVRDVLPRIPGLDECYGRSVFHCPYCDGWEWRDRRIAVHGRGTPAAGLSLALQTWSGDVVLVTDGRPRLRDAASAQLRERGIAIKTGAVTGLDHDSGMLRAIAFADGTRLERDAMFFTGQQRPQAPFAAALGCEVNRKGTIRTDRYGLTCVPDVYVVGDASRDVQFIVVAASEGAKAAVAINKRLQAEAGQTIREP